MVGVGDWGGLLVDYWIQFTIYIPNCQLLLILNQKIMNEHQQKQEKLQFLVKLTDKQAISTDFYLELSKKYQQISHHLLHLIKLFSKGFISFPNLDYWVNNLSITLDSTQYLKYGHSHPLFAYILRKYSLLVKQDNKNNNQRQVLQAIHNYQKSQYYNQTKHQQKWTNESKFLSSCQINEMIKKTTENMNYIQNPQCACCSPIFKRGSVVLNRNPEFSTIFGINQTKLIQSVVLEKYLCALANQGGGVLLFGADNIGFSVFVRGIFVNNEHSIVTIQQEIQTALQRLRPSCFFNVARVFVQQSSLSQNNTNQKQEDININRIVIRVCISPKQKNKLVYIETQKKLCHRVYESYQLSTQRELMKIVCQNKQNKEEPTSLYSKIVEKNKKKSFNRGHSSYISCTKPIDYRKQFKSITYLQKACNQQKQNCPQLPLTKQIDQKLQQLFFPYTHTSLLVVPNKNHDRYIIDFKIYLSECKLKCTMEKPFINYFKESMRSIWVISHEINIIKLKKNLKSFEQANALKTKTTIILMPVLSKFEFQKSKLNSEGLNSFLKKFSRYFNKHLQVHQVQVQQPETAKIMMFSNFQSKTEAIFAYMILEELSVRPYFFKEAQTHLKCKDDPTEKQ